MTTGRLSKNSARQLLDVVDFPSWGGVAIAGSGAFQVEAIIARSYPSLPVLSSDVSILSVALGRLLVGNPLTWRFTGALEFIEALGPSGPEDRLAALLVAEAMARYARGTTYDNVHLEYFRDTFREHQERALQSVRQRLAGPRPQEFHAVARSAIPALAAERGWGVVSLPLVAGREAKNLHKWLDTNIEWDGPASNGGDAVDLKDRLTELDDLVPYAIFTAAAVKGREPAAQSFNARHRTRSSYLYTNSSKTNTVDSGFWRDKQESFAYRKLDITALTRDSRVDIAPLSRKRFIFLTNVYLSRAIANPSVPDWAYVVYLDGMLAGAFGFEMGSRQGMAKSLYLMSDFSTVRGRVSKLIALLATSSTVQQDVRSKLLWRHDKIRTTIFTSKPNSMKYRGVFRLENRREGYINYVSEFREHGAQDLYTEWWTRWSGYANRPTTAG